MGRDDIITRVKSQDFPDGSYVVFGSGPLAAAGIRDTSDIDLIVTPKLYVTLQYQGWRFKEGIGDSPMLTNGEFEVTKEWCFGNYNPQFEHLLKTADVVDGVPFVNLQEVKKWKRACARAKDLVDIDSIDDYLQNSMV